MATRSSSDSRPHLSVTTPYQISKDAPGSDNPIPLSPQWLLPKPGDIKPAMTTVGNPPSSNPSFGNRSDIMKLSGNSEEVHDIQKKKDVFRPSLLDMETGRHDRWRDEERDTNSSLRKDRWRDGDKELGDNRRMDRWTENSNTKHFGEGRRVPSDRWTDPGNRDSNYEQRRESKWNTRWGPDDKEIDSMSEKWTDPGRDGNMHLDKGLTNVGNHVKDEKEGEHYRPWRSNSSLSRGRVEPQNQTLSSNKQVPLFSSSRAHGEHTPPTFSLGRGRVSSGGNSKNNSSTHTHSIGAFSDKVESGQGELYLRYSRTRLLDVYRNADMKSFQKLVDGFVEVPSLTIVEPLEPLALCTPNTEEMAVLKGIDKGDIISSGAPQISKDGRNQSDFAQSRRAKLGNREDLPPSFDDSKDESALGSKSGSVNCVDDTSSEKKATPSVFSQKIDIMHDHKILSDNKYKSEAIREDGGPIRKSNEVSFDRDSSVLSMPENSFTNASTPWRAQSPGDQSQRVVHDWKETPSDIKSRTSDIGWSKLQKNLNNEWEGNLADQPFNRDEAKWRTSEDTLLRRQLSGVLDREQEVRKPQHASPEELQLCYVDPKGVIQGPFSGADIIGWFEAGYFGIDLHVRLASAPKESPFLSLGDAMPHLRAKVRPPPGFAVPKQNEISDTTIRSNFNGIGQLHGGLRDVDVVRNEQRQNYGSTAEAENRFLESLMSTNTSNSPLQKFPLSEGLQGYIGNSYLNMPQSEVDNLLARRLALERQRSLPSPYSHWPGRDSASMISTSEIVPESKLLSSVTDNPGQPPHSQNADLMSVLQGLSTSAGVNSNVPVWSNFNVQGGLDLLQSKVEQHHDQGFPPQPPLGFQQRLQPQNQPPFPNLFSHVVDNSQGISTPETLLSTGLPQDPQLLNLLQQQYLLQLHSQTSVPTQQISLLDKLLLLKQQQKQEEQQMLLRQQQQLLSQVLSDQQSLQHFAEPSFGPLPVSAIPKGTSVDPRLQPTQGMFSIVSNMPVPLMQNELATNFVNIPTQNIQENHYNASSEASSSNLPHQMFEKIVHQKKSDGTPAEQIDDVCPKESLPASTLVESLPLLELINKTSECPVPKPIPVSDCFSTRNPEQPQKNQFRADVTVDSLQLEFPGDPVPVPQSVVCESENNVKLQSNDALKKQKAEGEGGDNELSTVVEVKNAEVHEPKKASEKKLRKQKSSKAHSSEQTKRGVSKSLSSQQMQQYEPGKSAIGDSKLDTETGAGAIDLPSLQRATDDGYNKANISALDVMGSQQVQRSVPTSSISGDNIESPRAIDSVAVENTQAHSVQRAWKLAPGFKPKSLLEIQQEEQRKAQTEKLAPETVSSVITLNTPWAGVVANADPKVHRETPKDAGNSELNSVKHESSLTQKSKKSPLHDLLAEEVLSKSSMKDVEISDSMSNVASLQVCPTLFESVDDNSFIEAKDAKKSRKKSAKSKGAGTKVSVPVTTSDAPISSSSVEKTKISRSAQQEKDVLPAIPSGPSLGDFVLWKGEPANPSPSPAWSTDSGKLSKPTSLRDILKEQEKKASSSQHGAQMPTPSKSQPIQASSRNSGPSWSLPSSSPAKAASPIQINSHALQSRQKGDDDLFWGPIDQTKQETKQAGFPQLSGQGSWGMKSTPQKGISAGSLSRQKSVGGKPSERLLSSSPASMQSSLKGKKDAMSKQSEAMDFRGWCESECIRLLGSKDTSVLEFCLKQSRSEAEILLIENLGSYDPDHEFIDKFLNYKELLPADVLEIAFQSQNDQKVTGFSGIDMNSDGDAIGDVGHDMGPDGSSKGGGKKKGKKGKKVSPAVLGFNVISNRIMMGEIQTVED